MRRLKVGVVFGGRSVEHEVSVVTAHQAMAALAPRHDVVPIYVTREGRWLTSPALNDLDVHRRRRYEQVGEDGFIPPSQGYGGLYVPGGRLRKPRRIPLDVAVPAIHGTFGEDGTLQGVLEMAGIPYTGSGVTASAVGMDKAVMRSVFRAAGLPVVPGVAVESERLAGDEAAVLDEVEAGIGYPAFVKPARAGSSVGIARSTDRATLREALGVAAAYDRRILVEKAMEGCIEVNCSVLGGPGVAPRASVCEQPVAWQDFLTFSDKYMRGGKANAGKAAGMAGQERRIPAPIPDHLTEEVQRNARAAFTAIDAAGVARIDSFVDVEGSRSWVMEINTTPGSFSFYLWEPSGLSFSDLMDELLEMGLRAHAARSELLFTYDSGMLDDVPGGKQSGG